MMKKRSLSGSIGIAVFVISLICIIVSFCSSNWLVSDHRIKNSKFESLGLWSHCFRSLPDPLDNYERRFYVGCRWVFDPFTHGYDQIKGFLMPPFFIVTQFFYTLAFIGILLSFIMILLFFLCFGPEHKFFVLLITAITSTMFVVAVCSTIAVVVFAIWANKPEWMPGHDNNFFGWAFVLAVIGTFTSYITAILFAVEAILQRKKKKYLKESQTRFEIEQETKT